MRIRVLAILLVIGAWTWLARATDWFVATNGSDAAAGTNWTTALQSIQAGVDAAAPGDTVWVSNGVYATGGRVVGGSGTNRVVITKAITVRSLNGPQATAIEGAGPNGPAAIRCVYLNGAPTLSGFTLKHGATRTTGDNWGGGAYVLANATLTNCIITSNSASFGAGVYLGTILNCEISYNQAVSWGGGSFGSSLILSRILYNQASHGGGAAQGRVINCLVYSNTATMNGGGVYIAAVNHATIVGNAAGGSGGGVFQGGFTNTICYFNTATTDPNYSGAVMVHSCVTPDPGGVGNLASDPWFADAASGDFRLLLGSPCISAGLNSALQTTTDLDGNERLLYGITDLGAYEFPHPSGYQGWAYAITNGLTNLTDSATGDGYPNLLKYATGSSATTPDTQARLTAYLTGNQLNLNFYRNTNAAVDATLYVESAPHAGNDSPWTGLATNRNGSWGGATNVAESAFGTPRSVRVTAPMAGTTQRFFRLRVTRP